MDDLAAAVFRPDDERLERAVDLLCALGATPVPDPMLAVEPTGAEARADADYAILTSKTGAELVAERGWTPGEATVCAVGPKTADALEAEGYDVDLVPEEYTSSGLVAALDGNAKPRSATGRATEGRAGVDGARVEVARSDHGSETLLDGLRDAGAYVHETVLYRLVRPEGSGESAELAADRRLDVALFTSSLTVEHFLEAAAERGRRDDALAGLEEAVVGAIGEPTRETAAELGVAVDVVPPEATFEALARGAVDAATADE